METLKVIIELGKGQTYYAYTSGSEHISSYAEDATAEEAKANLLQALEEVKRLAPKRAMPKSSPTSRGSTSNTPTILPHSSSTTSYSTLPSWLSTSALTTS